MLGVDMMELNTFPEAQLTIYADANAVTNRSKWPPKGGMVDGSGAVKLKPKRFIVRRGGIHQRIETS